MVFTVHYLVLRGFYALELTRTVFYVQCVVAAVNIVAAVLLVRRVDAAGTSPALVGAYATAYAVGAALSYLVLHRRLGSLETPRLLRFVARLAVAVGVATAVAGLVALGLGRLLEEPGWGLAAVRGLVVTVVGGVAYLAHGPRDAAARGHDRAADRHTPRRPHPQRLRRHLRWRARPPVRPLTPRGDESGAARHPTR